MQIQSIADNICEKYHVKCIPVKTQSTRLSQGLACYVTYRIKRNRKIERTNHPRYILIGNHNSNRLPVLELAHELAHHILNMKQNSLAHSNKHGELEDTIGLYISRLAK